MVRRHPLAQGFVVLVNDIGGVTLLQVAIAPLDPALSIHRNVVGGNPFTTLADIPGTVHLTGIQGNVRFTGFGTTAKGSFNSGCSTPLL